MRSCLTLNGIADADLTDVRLHVFHAVPLRCGVIDEDKRRPGPLRHIESRNSF